MSVTSRTVIVTVVLGCCWFIPRFHCYCQGNV